MRKKIVLKCKIFMCTVFAKFLSKLFDFGDCAGSLIKEVLNLFRLFQRISATRTFTAHLSSDCYKMFSWAIDFLDLIRAVFYFEPFTKYQKFYLFTYALPMTITVFITAACSSYLFFGFIWGYYIFCCFGMGIGYIGIDTKYAIIGCIVPVVVIAFICYGCFKWNIFSVFRNLTINEAGIDCCPSHFNFIKITFSLTQALITLTLMMIPLLLKNGNLAILYAFLAISVIVLSLIIETIFSCIHISDYFEDDDDIETQTKGLDNFIALGLQIYSILIVPGAEKFLDVITNEYKRDWRCYIGYAFFSILLPIALMILMVLGRIPTILEKYRYSVFAFFEVVDIVRQIIYAFVAAYDYVYACIGIESFWVVIIIVFRPYSNVSEYFKELGNSLVLITGQAITKAAENHGTEFISFKLSLGLLIAVCVPSVLAIYFYFIFDFWKKSECEFDEETLFILAILVRFISPFAFVVFGLNISTLTKSNQLL